MRSSSDGWVYSQKRMKGLGSRIFQVFFTHYLKGLNICGVGVSYNSIGHFQAELVGLALVMT